METWVFYGMISAVLIAMRDYFTSNHTSKYTTTEHLFYYYLVCAASISAYVCYKKFNKKENFRLIEKNDLWKYILVGVSSVMIITPCEVMSIRSAKNPGKARALTNMNFIVLFLVSVYFLKSEKMTPKKIGGIILTLLGVYMIV